MIDLCKKAGPGLVHQKEDIDVRECQQRNAALWEPATKLIIKFLSGTFFFVKRSENKSSI